ncbi:MAG: hypothetical protein P1V81_07890 [Planctomycetota bacterium]|nr:hypothetical protein [Planctomycetota bacterium]
MQKSAFRLLTSCLFLAPPALGQAADFPFFEGFEATSLQVHWSTSSPWGAGRAQLTTAGGPQSGDRHLTLDAGSQGVDSNVVADLQVDLSGSSSVLLEFGVRDFGDEYETSTDRWLGPGAKHYDGVFLSDDGGVTWAEALALDDAATGGNYQKHTLDLDALVAAAGMTYNANFLIRFSWQGDHAIPGDGFAFDDIGLRALEYQDLGSLTSTTPTVGGSFGASLVAIADLNLDGVPELAVGHPGYDGGRGRLEIYSGKDLVLLGLTPAGAVGDFLGETLANLGDLNGDGFDELLLGAPKNSKGGTGSGAAHVFSTKSGAKLKSLYGQSASEGLGTALCAAPDLDGDGLREIVVGIPGADGTAGIEVGRVRIFSGGTFDLLLEVEGSEAFERLGSSVDVFGDLDGDGKPDLIAGATNWADPSAPSEVRGAARVFSSATGALLRTFEGAGGDFGASVAGVGDLDGDAVVDWVVGAPGAELGAGVVLYLSGADGSLLTEELGQLPGARFGAVLERVGDVDGDGDADLGIGSDTAQGGQVRVRELPGLMPLVGIEAASTSAGFGRALAGTGDLDGDGKGDLAIASPGEGLGVGVAGGRVRLAGTSDVPRMVSVDGLHCATSGQAVLAGNNFTPSMVVRVGGQAVDWQYVSPVQVRLELEPDVPGGFRDLTIWTDAGSQGYDRVLPRYPAFHAPEEAPLGSVVSLELDNGEPGSFVLAFSAERYAQPASFSAWGWYHGLELNGVWVAAIGKFTALQTSHELLLPAPTSLALVGAEFHLQAWTHQASSAQMGFTDTMTVRITN